MIRLKNFNTTGVAPDGVFYAGDINAIQDAVAALNDYTQHINLGGISIGDAAIQLLKYGTAEARISAALRTDGPVRALGGVLPGNFTTTTRNAIPVGSRPFTLLIFNTTTGQYEYNAGSDATPSWVPIVASSIADGSVTLAKLAANSVDSSKLVDGTIVAGDISGTLKPSVSAAAGTEALRAIGVTASTAAAGNDARFTDTRTPTDGTVTDAKVAVGAGIVKSKLNFSGANGLDNSDIASAAGILYSKLNLAASIVHGDVAVANKDGAAATPSMRTLGTGALQAAAGNDARLSDARTPVNNTVSTSSIQNNAVTAAKVANDVATQAELDAEAASRVAADNTLTSNLNGLAGIVSGMNLVRASSDVVVLDGSSEKDVDFSVAFPTACLGVVLTNGDKASGEILLSSVPAGLDRFGFKIHAYKIGPGLIPGDTIRVNYVAVGY